MRQLDPRRTEVDYVTGIPNGKFLDRGMFVVCSDLARKILEGGDEGATQPFEARRIAEQRLADGKRVNPGVLTVVQVDLDHFKEINDLHGHNFGDLTLMGFARALHEGGSRGSRRREDIAAMTGRSGGEEFTKVLYQCDPASAVSVMEVFREGLTLRRAPPGGPKGEKLDFSAGIATMDFRDLAFDLQLMSRDNGGVDSFLGSQEFATYMVSKFREFRAKADKAAFMSKMFGRGLTVVHCPEVDQLMRLNVSLSHDFRTLKGEYLAFCDETPIDHSLPLIEYARAKSTRVKDFVMRKFGTQFMPRGSKNLFYDIVDAMDVCESPRNNQEYAIALMDETLASQGIDMHSALRESVSADDVLQEHFLVLMMQHKDLKI